ncbi:MAG: hypothetical protein DWH79_00895 [Planctomycetota bacterium]|nr:MAG: hypothetical protein DWH79_00895 [Planctomycetota bacterium]
MDRRRFLQAGSLVGGIGLLPEASPAAVPAIATPQSALPRPARLLADYTADDHRRRLENVAFGNARIGTSLRKHLVTNYLPAQCCYNLGEYPATEPWNPGEEDEAELDRLQALGVQVIQVFDDWNDSLRLFGGDKYSPVNRDGYIRFLAMARARGIKVLTYVSTCFLQTTDPDYDPAWNRPGDVLVVGYWKMARCSPASPGWRAFVMRKIAHVIEEWGGDGIYIDGGYLMNRHERKRQMPLAADEIPAFGETPQEDGAFADLLALIHADVKRRGGIVKLHVDGADKPLTDLVTYDYLWVGEGVANADGLRETVKHHPPYVVPCLDMGFTSLESIDEPFLQSIPYLQFPVTFGGRIFTGQRGFIPGVAYNDDFWLKRCRDAKAQFDADKTKLHTYSAWDEVPGSPATRIRWGEWLARYLPLVEEGTWAWLEIGESGLFTAPLPEGVVASALANRGFHLVLANYNRAGMTVTTTDPYRNATDAAPATTWTVFPRSLLILEKA